MWVRGRVSPAPRQPPAGTPTLAGRTPRPVHLRPLTSEPTGPRRRSPLAPARLPGLDPSPGPAAASAAEGRTRQVSRPLL